jgi:hypothetical protein
MGQAQRLRGSPGRQRACRWHEALPWFTPIFFFFLGQRGPLLEESKASKTWPPRAKDLASHTAFQGKQTGQTGEGLLGSPVWSQPCRAGGQVPDTSLYLSCDLWLRCCVSLE